MIFVLAYFIAKVFLIVFETAIDTVLQCYLMDMEMAQFSDRPLMCSASLKHMIEQNKQQQQNANEEDLESSQAFMQ